MDTIPRADAQAALEGVDELVSRQAAEITRLRRALRDVADYAAAEGRLARRAQAANETQALRPCDPPDRLRYATTAALAAAKASVAERIAAAAAGYLEGGEATAEGAE